MMEKINKDFAFLTGEEVRLSSPVKLHEFFELLLKNQPKLGHKMAVKDSKTEITFSELSTNSRQVAEIIQKFVQENSLQPNKDGDWIIAVCLRPSIEEIIALLGVLKAGAAYLPFDEKFSENRNLFILQDSAPISILTSREVMENAPFASVVEKSGKLVLYIEDLLEQIQTAEFVEIDETSSVLINDSLAVVLYTSGSTGVPKGVRLSHQAIVYRFCWLWKDLPFSKGDICVAKTTRSFVDSVTEIWSPLLRGVPVVVVDEHIVKNVELFVPVLEENKITRLFVVPSHLIAIMEYLDHSEKKVNRLGDLRLCICTSEILPSDLALKFFNYFKNTGLCNFYGTTEVTGDIAFILFKCKEEAAKTFWNGKVPLGRPFDNCQIYLMSDSGGSQLAQGEEMGEIYIAGEMLADGYVNNREGHRFVEVNLPGGVTKRMYGTGDYGRIVNGLLYYEGRSDSQIKVRGFRVDLEEVMAAIRSCPSVSSVTVLCYASGKPDQHIVAFIKTEEGTTPDQIYAYVRDKLMPYMIPKIVVVEDMPLLVNGKTDRQTLLSQYESILQQERSIDFRLDNSELLSDPSLRDHAEKLLKCVSSVLGGGMPSKVRMNQSFFQIGGSSLSAAAVVMKLKDQGYSIASNIGEVIEHLRSVQPKKVNTETEKYQVELLQDHMKEEVIKLMSIAFCTKDVISIASKTTYDEYYRALSNFWQHFIQSNISLVIKDENGKILAAILSVQGFPELDLSGIGEVITVIQYVGWVQNMARKVALLDSEPETKIAHLFFLGTEKSLSDAENVLLAHRLEEETINYAKRNNYDYLISENFNELTQHLVDVNGYQVLVRVNANQFTTPADYQPFADLPDSVTCECCLKTLRDE